MFQLGYFKGELLVLRLNAAALPLIVTIRQVTLPSLMQ